MCQKLKLCVMEMMSCVRTLHVHARTYACKCSYIHTYMYELAALLPFYLVVRMRGTLNKIGRMYDNNIYMENRRCTVYVGLAQAHPNNIVR